MSAFATNFDAPFHDRVEFHVDRLKATTIALAAVASGMMIAVPPALQPSLLIDGPKAGASIVALGGATILVAVGVYILLRIGLWRGPAVIIDAFGIHDRRAGAIMTPWSSVRDVRVLDRHGHHIAIDLGGNPQSPRRNRSWLGAALRMSQAESLTVIDTFFLRSATGNRILDFIMPLTALTPIDLSETPVSEQTLRTDARIAQRRAMSILIFLISAGLIPGVAALSIAL